MVDMGALIGSIRRFGLVGPAYEIVGPGRSTASGEQQMCVRLVETGEGLDYLLADILADPSEA